MSCSVAVDIGGTFTDIVLRLPDGRMIIDKTLTTPHDLIEGFMRGVRSVLQKASLRPADIDGLIVHATTVVTNSLIERKGRPTALLVTEGFCDTLLIRNENRYDVYDTQIEFAEPLVPRDHTYGVTERTLADGRIMAVPDIGEIRQIARVLHARGVSAVAICFLNSFANPANERLAADLLAREMPDAFICTSFDVAPVIREYPRTSTTAVNAYTMPIARPYLDRLSERLRADGFSQSPLIMLSSGGVVGSDRAGRSPVRMIESGPAAGALAAAYYGERIVIERLIAFDMGGTTAKASLIENGIPLVTGEFEVDRRYRFKQGSGMPIAVPSIDLIEIGAGGGSIAHLDALGLLKVGPESAGSVPGPACYSRGGTSPTVTDANLVLGLLDANNFLGGEMILDRNAAEQAIGRIAAKLELPMIQAARGIFRIVNETMASSVRTHATDRGVDYRNLPLFAFGGAGAIHACAVAELLSCATVIVPPKSSVLSAVGTLVTPARLDLMRSYIASINHIDWDRVSAVFREMREEALGALEEASGRNETIELHYEADLRYHGQQYEVTVALDFDPDRAGDHGRLQRLFEQAYLALYGNNPSNVGIEVVTWRLSARTRLDHTPIGESLPLVAGPRRGRREVNAFGDAVEADVFSRDTLALGQVMPGPAIIEERETTTIVPPGWWATIDRFGCIVISTERS
ncbi:MAG: hydantoinase/oxoprolinase family protein [Pseudorhodoplanes sp.]|uniref:hydantoinase/oxoprolinase family protein n=1 Tax=Pseudorhodoplanes sp. TaxID=1934341 RepID=UPI003D1034DB